MSSAAPRTIALGQLLPDFALPDHLANQSVGTLSLDSRKVKKGGTFIALPGHAEDGRRFIVDALGHGAELVFEEAEDDSFELKDFHQMPLLSIPHLSSMVSEIASDFFDSPSRDLKVVGITGTNGKTTCSMLLAQLNQALGQSSAVIGTLGFGFLGGEKLQVTGLTTPDAISTQEIFHALRDAGADAVMMEVSSHSLDQNRVAAVDFDFAVFTNLSRDHLDYHGSMEHYGAAKKALFEMGGLSASIINIDDEFGRELAKALDSNAADLYTYSLNDKSADVYAENTVFSSAGVSAKLISPWGTHTFNSVLLGEYNLSNLLAVITTAGAQGFEFSDLVAAIPKLLAVEGRMQQVDVKTDIQVIVDYAHTPDALEKTLRALRVHTEAQLWSVFGCGGDRDTGKRPLMASVSEAHADHIVVTSDNPRTESPEAIVSDVLAGLSRADRAQSMVDRREAIAYAISEAGAGDTVLIAGKGHEDYQLVGDQVLHFSDYEEAQAALLARATIRGLSS
jgi:UDP-N-acetylmuramoyl-L-alanyl-D-glutamate--2,6-diaminopimelate ligase